MSKRVMILLAVGVLTIFASFMLLKYEMSKPIDEYEETSDETEETNDKNVQEETNITSTSDETANRTE